MNHIFRLVWNRRLGVLQVASEFTRGRTKGGRSAEGGTGRAVWLAALPLSVPLLAFAATSSPGAVAVNALPTGGQVTHGSGQIAQRGDTLTVNQQSQNLSLNWQTFNVGSQSTVNFVQPGASSIAVNRIADTQGSQIFGHLNANGQVFLINPNGVLFGKSAQVNVGGLVASTLDVNDSALGTGSLTFSGTGKGNVTNLGTINVTSGGYAALLGNQVSNQGAIHAQLGSVALAGGSAITLNFGGSKLVSVQVDKSELNALAQNGQLIEANGGQVWMTAGARDSLLASAVNNTGTIEAQTVQSQNGHITLLGGMDAGTVSMSGTLDASAPLGGNGGEIETSAANVHVADTAKITTAAVMGLSGTWLIDPTDFTIGPGKTGTVSGGTPSGDISGATLSAALSVGNVVIESSQGSTSGSGNVNVNDAVSWGSYTLRLDAQNNININATMTASGTAGLVLNYGGFNGSSVTTPAAGTSVLVGLGGSGFAGQVNFTGSNTLTINNNDYSLINSAAALQNIPTTGLGKRYALAGNLTLSGSFNPIGSSAAPFTGVLEGLGHTISGLTINSSATGPGSSVGLFGTSSGTIRNLGLLGGSVAGNGSGTSIGGLAGNNLGAISNVYSTVAVSGDGTQASGQWLGGLVGNNESQGTISNAYAKGAVSVSSYGAAVGGLVGTNYGSIRNAYATGAVSGSYGGTGAAGNNMGGLVGYNLGDIQAAYATGSVSWNGGGTNNGNFLGGLVGASANSQVGTTGTITDTYATGKVSSGDSSDLLGGLIGSYQGGPLTANYWDTTTSNQANGAGNGAQSGITGLSNAQMQQASSFAWSIATSGGGGSPWRIYNGSTTPLIESLLVPLTISASDQTVTYNGTNQFAAVFNTSLASTDYSAITAPGLTAAQHASHYTESLASAYSYNYDLSVGTPSAALTINPLTLTASLANAGVTKVYDGTTAAPNGFTPTYAYAGLLSGDTAVSLSNTGIAYNSAHVNSANSVTVSGLAISGVTGSNGSLASDYTLASSSLTTAATITAAPLTVSLTNTTNVTKTYDGTTAAPTGFSPTYSVAGLVSGDAASVSSAQAAVYNSAHVLDATAIVQGGISLDSVGGNAVAGDYSLSSTSASTGAGIASITPRTLTVTTPTIAGVLTKVYDGSTLATGAYLNGGNISGQVSGDNVSLDTSGTVLSYNSSHVVGANSISASGSLGVSLLSSSVGSQSSDYSVTIPFIASVAGSITRAPLSVALSNITNVSKTYDGTTTAPLGFTPSYSITGLISGDAAAVGSSATPVFNSAHVTSADAITQGGLSLTSINGSNGSALSDYALTSATASTGLGVAYISPLMLSATAPTIGGVSTKVYDGTTTAVGATLSGGSVNGGLAGDNLVLDTSGVVLNYNSSHVASASNISASGSLGVDIAGSTNGSQSTDYSVTLPSIASVAGTITPASLTAILTNAGVTKTYDGTTNAPVGFVPTYSYTGLVSGDTSATLTDSGAAYNSSQVLGATYVTVSGLALGGMVGSNGSQVSDYTLRTSSSSISAYITPATLTASLAGSISKSYDGTDTATLASGNYLLSGFVSGDGATVTQGNGTYNSSNVAGATTVTATLGGGDFVADSGTSLSNYTLPVSASGAASITPVSLVVTANNASKTYDGQAYAGGNGATYSGLVNGETASVLGGTLVYGGNSQGAVNAGSYTLTPSGLSSGNYTISYGDGLLTVNQATLTASLVGNISKMYDGTTAATLGSSNYALAGVVGGDVVNLNDPAAGTYATSNAGSGIGVQVGGLVISGSGASNYILGNSTASGAIGTITAAPLTVTANNASTTYSAQAYRGGNGVTYSGFVDGQDATALGGALSYGGSSQGAANAGSYALTPGGLASGNYAITYVSGMLTITPAPLTVTANNASATYNAQAYGGGNGVTYSGFVGGQGASVLGGTLSYSGSSQGAVNVGNYTLTPGGLASGNYAITYDSGTLTITPAPLTVTANNASTTYNAQAYSGANGVTYRGFVGGQDATVLSGTLSYSGNSQGAVNVGSYALTPGGLASGNYAITYDSGILTITPATLTYVATQAQAYAGQAIPVLAGTVTGWQGSDTQASATTGTLTFTTSATTRSPVGQYAVTGSGLVANDGNYVFVQSAGNASAFDVVAAAVTQPVGTLPGVAYAQQLLGKQAPDGLLVSTTNTTDGSSSTGVPLRSATPAAAPDLYTPDVRVVGGGVRLP